MDQHFQQTGDSELVHDNVIQFALKCTAVFMVCGPVIININFALFYLEDNIYAIRYNSCLIKYNLFKKLNKINYINYFLRN